MKGHEFIKEVVGEIMPNKENLREECHHKMKKEINHEINFESNSEVNRNTITVVNESEQFSVRRAPSVMKMVLPVSAALLILTVGVSFFLREYSPSHEGGGTTSSSEYSTKSPQVAKADENARGLYMYTAGFFCDLEARNVPTPDKTYTINTKSPSFAGNFDIPQANFNYDYKSIISDLGLADSYWYATIYIKETPAPYSPVRAVAWVGDGKTTTADFDFERNVWTGMDKDNPGHDLNGNVVGLYPEMYTSTSDNPDDFGVTLGLRPVKDIEVFEHFSIMINPGWDFEYNNESETLMIYRDFVVPMIRYDMSINADPPEEFMAPHTYYIQIKTYSLGDEDLVKMLAEDGGQSYDRTVGRTDIYGDGSQVLSGVEFGDGIHANGILVTDSVNVYEISYMDLGKGAEIYDNLDDYTDIAENIDRETQEIVNSFTPNPDAVPANVEFGKYLRNMNALSTTKNIHMITGGFLYHLDTMNVPFSSATIELTLENVDQFGDDLEEFPLLKTPEYITEISEIFASKPNGKAVLFVGDGRDELAVAWLPDGGDTTVEYDFDNRHWNGLDEESVDDLTGLSDLNGNMVGLYPPVDMYYD